MKENNQPKDTALGRRRFLLKSAGVAGVLSVPALSEASIWRAVRRFFRETKVPNVIPVLPPVINPIGNEVPPITDGILPPINTPSLDGYPDEIRYIGNPHHKNKVWKQDHILKFHWLIP